MKQLQISSFFRTLGEAFGRCARRFPVTLSFALALTALQLWLTATDWHGEEKLLVTLFYFLSVGTLLSLSLHLWAEEVKRRKLRLGVQILAPVLLALDAIFLYHNIEGTRAIDIGIAHGAALLAIGLSLFFLPFFRERDDIPAWNFAQTAIGTLALTLIVGAVMSGGLSLLALSLHQLFGVDVSHKCYLYILILCCELLPLLMFLGLLPEGERKHDRQPQPTAFLQGIIHYLFLPLAGLYLLVLYIYAGTILTRWELPDGWVSWLVVALMAGVIAIELGLYPSRIKAHKPTDERIARWLPLLALPLLVLMTVGIGRRFLDYGITINRLYLATLNAWFYFVCIGLIVSRARRLSWIPISFSLVFLLTSVLPVNYTSLTRHTLHKEVREAFAQSGQDSLPLSTDAYAAWLLAQPREEARLISSKLAYLDDWFGTESTSDLVAAGTSFAVIAEEEAEPGLESYAYHQPTGYTTKLPQGYAYATYFSRGNVRPNRITADSTLCIALGSRDTLCIPLDTLRALDANPQSTPPLLRTNRGNVFLLTLINYYPDLDEPEEEGRQAERRVDLEGYLFSNQRTKIIQ